MSGALGAIIEAFVKVPMFAALEHDDLYDIARMARPFRLDAGSVLFREEDAADGMYLVLHGELEVTARIPGDETVKLACVRGGELLGELSLLDRGRRSATATCTVAASGYHIGRRHFELWRSDLRPAIRALMRRLTREVCTRVRRVFVGITSALADGAGVPGRGLPPSTDPEPVDASQWPSSAAAIPFLRELTAEELDDLLQSARLVSCRRGAQLQAAKSPAESAFFVVRGALRTTVLHAGRSLHFAVHPPGSLVGALGILDGEETTSVCSACEPSLVLCIDAEQLRLLRNRTGPLSWKLEELIHRTIVRTLRLGAQHMARFSLERNVSGNRPVR